MISPLGAAGAAIALLAAGAALVCGGSACAPAIWELRVLEWFAAQRSPALDAFLSTVTWLGSLWLLLPLAIAFAAIQLARGYSSRAARFAAAFGGAVALIYAAKALVARARPAVVEPLIAMPVDASYPSAHTAQITAFVLAAILTLALPHGRGGWIALALLAIVLVGVSRIYLQVHFPSDVLAGAAAAALWVLAFAPAQRGRHA